jgi:NitT/TauT family transport system substrate-binding protein
VYTTNEPIVLKAQGYTFNELKVADYLQLVGNGLVTNEKTIAGDPELVRGMGRALARGIRDSAQDPAAAYEICKKFVPDLGKNDEAVQKQVLAASIDVWNTARPGQSDPQAWANMNDLLVKMGLLTQPVELEKAFTNDFAPQE